MTIEAIIQQIKSLPVGDRIRVLADVWDSIADDAPEPPLTEEQRQLFARRAADLQANPEIALTWDQIKGRIKGGS